MLIANCLPGLPEELGVKKTVTTKRGNKKETTADYSITSEENDFSKLIQALLPERKEKKTSSTALSETLQQQLIAIFPQMQTDLTLINSENGASEEFIESLSGLTGSKIMEMVEDVSSEESISDWIQAMINQEEVIPASDLPTTTVSEQTEEGEELLVPLETAETLSFSLPESGELHSLGKENSPPLMATESAEEVKESGQSYEVENLETEPKVTGEAVTQSFYQPVEMRGSMNLQQDFSGGTNNLAESKVAIKEEISEEKPHTLDLSEEREAKTPSLAVESFKGKKPEPVFNPVVSSTPPRIAEELKANKEVSTPLNISEEKLTTQILHGAKMMVKDGVSKIQLQLEPAELGKLELSIVIERDLVAAKFVTESQGVQSLIESNLSQLRSSLQEVGLKVDLLQVGVQTDNNQQMPYQSSFTGYQRERGSSFSSEQVERWAVEDTSVGNEAWQGLVNIRV